MRKGVRQFRFVLCCDFCDDVIPEGTGIANVIELDDGFAHFLHKGRCLREFERLRRDRSGALLKKNQILELKGVKVQTKRRKNPCVIGRTKAKRMC